MNEANPRLCLFLILIFRSPPPLVLVVTLFWRLAIRMWHLRRAVTRFLYQEVRERVDALPNIACFSSDRSTVGFLLDMGDVEFLNLLESRVFSKLERRSVCLDVGANIGRFSLFFSRFFEKVIAIEPHPVSYRLLRLNADLANNIVPVNKGCSNLNRKARLIAPSVKAANAAVALSDNDVPLAHSLNPSRASDPVDAFEVDLERLDDMEEVNDAASVDFIKIDVEGHERLCLEGSMGIIGRHRPVIGCEMENSIADDDRTYIIQTLRENGYEYMYEMRSTRSKFLRVLTGFLPLRRSDEFGFDFFLTSDLPRRNHAMVLFSCYPLD